MNADLCEKIAIEKDRMINDGHEPNALLINPELYRKELSGSAFIWGLRIAIDSTVSKEQGFIVAENAAIAADNLRFELATLKTRLKTITEMLEELLEDGESE